MESIIWKLVTLLGRSRNTGSCYICYAIRGFMTVTKSCDYAQNEAVTHDCQFYS